MRLGMPFSKFLLAISFVAVSARGFTFSAGAPSECDDLTVTWSGGQPPFHLILMPPGGAARNISIPDSAFQDSHGSFTTQLNVPANDKLILSMSDATSMVAGGVSNLLVVAPSESGRKCNTTDPNNDFFFTIPDSLLQCKPYAFTQFSGAILPLNVMSYVPGGNASVVQSPSSGDSYNWPADLAGGTSVVFSVTDSQGRNGGLSPIVVVQTSDDSSCLSASSTPSTSFATSPVTVTTTPTASTTSTSRPGAVLSSGAIAGIAIGCTAIMALFAFLLLVCLRKRRHNSPNGPVDLTYDPSSRPETVGLGVPVAQTAMPFSHPPSEYSQTPLHPAHSTTYYSSVASDSSTSLYTAGRRPLQAANATSYYSSPGSESSMREAASFISGSSGYASGSKQHQAHSYYNPSRLHLVNSTAPSSSKLAGESQMPAADSESSAYTARRVVVHQDIEESLSPPLELPPQYSDRRIPLAEITSSPQAKE